MTRKQLRSLLEGFGIDPSFIIVRSEEDRALIRCKDENLKKESKKILKEHRFDLIRGRDGLFDKDTITLEFHIPEKYRPKKIVKTFSEILGEMEQAYKKPSMYDRYYSTSDD